MYVVIARGGKEILVPLANAWQGDGMSGPPRKYPAILFLRLSPGGFKSTRLEILAWLEIVASLVNSTSRFVPCMLAHCDA